MSDQIGAVSEADGSISGSVSEGPDFFGPLQ